MTGFENGDIAVGSKHEYVHLISPVDGSSIMFIHQEDDIQRKMDNAMGVTFNAKVQDMYTALTPDESMRGTPHDICWFPDNSGLLVAVVPDIGRLEFRKYDFDGNILYGPGGSLGPAWTNPRKDFGWAQETVKIDLACDSKTVYYTDSMRTVFRYDLETSTQLADYQRLTLSSPYIYGGVKFLPTVLAHITAHGLEIGPVVVVAMTKIGDGPSRAICLGKDRSVWTDQIHPLGGTYHVFKHKLLNGSIIFGVITEANPDMLNDRTLSLACCVAACKIGGIMPQPQLIS